MLSIKALHHGTIKQIKLLIKEIERIIKPRGLLMLEVPRKKEKKKTDLAQYKEIEPNTVIPLQGPEAGVPHHIFDKEEICKLLSNFEILSLHATGEDNIQTPSPHWTLIARFMKKGV